MFGQAVRIEVIDVDRYQREVGRIYLGERFINMDMVRDGFAWRYTQYDMPGEFTAAETDARQHRRGLWVDPNPVPPWEWRLMKRQAKSAHRFFLPPTAPLLLLSVMETAGSPSTTPLKLAGK